DPNILSTKTCALSIEFSDLYAHKKEVPTGTLRLQRFTNALKIREISNSCLATLFTYKGTLFIVIYVYFLDLHRPISFLAVTNTHRSHTTREYVFLESQRSQRLLQNLSPVNVLLVTE